MRHSNSGKKLSRTPSHRKALFRNMAKALLTHGKIRTTEIKAKELRKIVEPLITLALRNDLHARRQAYRVLGNHQLVKRLFDEIGPAFAGVAGGYTRVLKLDTPRRGDNAPMAIIELTHIAGAVEAEAPAPAPAEEVKPKRAPRKKAEPKAEAEEAKPAKKAPAAKAAKAPAAKAAKAEAADAPAEEAKPKRAPRKKAEAAPAADAPAEEAKPKRAPRKKAEPKTEE